MAKQKYQFVTMFYNCYSEEPKSYEWGRKVINLLTSNNIEYKKEYPEDEHYECSVYAIKPDHMSQKEFENFIKNM